MISLSKDEARLYNYMMEVIDQVMDNYGYDYVIGKNISKKYYTNNLENINLFKRLGLEDVELSINKNDELCNLLDILDIEYLSNIDSDKLKWNYIYDDEIIGTGSLNSFKVDIKKLLSVLMNNINGEYNSKFNVILHEEDLKKGIVSIKDNHLEEEIKIDEAEITDYLLGNI